jgi:hypothetical protein
MTGEYIYLSYPFAFNIAVIVAGYYAGGNYYQIEADQFVSKDTLETYTMLVFRDCEPRPFPMHNCDSCDKICHNLRCTVSCCDYEPMPGLQAVGNV